MNQRYRSPTVVAAMNAQQQQNTLWRDAPPDLTPRELEMVELMVEGLSDRQIAEKMLVSDETARSHGKNLRQKLGCKTRSEAVAKLLRLGLARLTINLPKNLDKRLELHAHDKDSSLSALIIQLIKDEIGRNP